MKKIALAALLLAAAPLALTRRLWHGERDYGTGRQT